ncbi:hypothetical protein [Sinanaerobacter chloroacetimidivorans]|uniref:Uncharacterized protein n=1 Tax=Sinanaerobacter chloroacetimidivorans TaxID=2818044 RepID=A0A8J8B0Z0_9FIRM|nr:hypothetical protein [Sinanaerobacter chloroacetimidivorans]MBR0597669.1 hypothetical protein [Sinanaerobacter chloroacetimidivorans]
MKILIVGVAIILINVMSLTFHADYARYELTEQAMKNEADKCAAAAVLYFNEEAYGEGELLLKDEDAVATVEGMLNKKCTWQMHIFDDSGRHRTYEDGKLKTDTAFSYPYTFIDEAGHETVIEQPAVIVTVSYESDFYRLNGVPQKVIMRSSMYTVNGRR